MSSILRTPIMILVAVAVFSAGLFSCGREFLAVDACLDRGGVYDDAAGACRYDVERLPRRSLAFLFRAPDAGMLLAAITGASAAVLVIVARWRVGRHRCPAS